MVMGSCLGFETPCDLLIPACRSSSFVESSRPLSECCSHILARYILIVLYETWQAMKQQKYRKVSDEARNGIIAYWVQNCWKALTPAWLV